MQNAIVGLRSIFSKEVSKEVAEIQTDKNINVRPAYIENKKSSWNSESAIPVLLTNADILIRHNEKSTARVLIYKALAIDSSHPLALKKAAEVLGPEANLEQLTAIYEKICESDYRFETIAELAQVYYRRGMNTIALEKYYEALSLLLNESNLLFEVYKNIGNILTCESDFAGAEEYYNKAYSINSKSDALLVNLGTLEIQRQEPKVALTRFQQALEINDKNEKAWIGLALVYQIMGEPTLAIANVENAIDLDPNNKTAIHLFANLAVSEGKTQAAMERLQEYLSTVDLDIDMSFVLVHLFCQMNQFTLAHLEIDRVLLWDPGNKEALALESEIKKMMKGNF